MGVPDFAFPDHEDIPAQGTKGIQVSLIPSPIAFNFGRPSAGIVDGPRRAFAFLMSMPKAAMNEHDLPMTRQNDIGCTRKIFSV